MHELASVTHWRLAQRTADGRHSHPYLVMKTEAQAMSPTEVSYEFLPRPSDSEVLAKDICFG